MSQTFYIYTPTHTHSYPFHLWRLHLQTKSIWTGITFNVLYYNDVFCAYIYLYVYVLKGVCVSQQSKVFSKQKSWMVLVYHLVTSVIHLYNKRLEKFLLLIFCVLISCDWCKQTFPNNKEIQQTEEQKEKLNAIDHKQYQNQSDKLHWGVLHDAFIFDKFWNTFGVSKLSDYSIDWHICELIKPGNNEISIVKTSCTELNKKQIINWVRRACFIVCLINKRYGRKKN